MLFCGQNQMDTIFELNLSDVTLSNLEYTLLILDLSTAFFIAAFIVSASYFLSMQNPDSEKLSAYECGFEPYDDTKHVFNVRFCVIAILFIVFDIEIMFLIPWCSSLSGADLLGFWVMVDFIFELLVGLFYVWYAGALDWT